MDTDIITLGRMSRILTAQQFDHVPPHSHIVSKLPHCVVTYNERWRHEELVVSFRGSEKIEDYTLALLSKPHAMPDGSRIHSGAWLLASTVFHHTLKTLVEIAISRGKRIIFNGHSLGGSVAMIVASLTIQYCGPRHRDQVRVYTFGMMPFIYESSERWRELSHVALDVCSAGDVIRNDRLLCLLASKANSVAQFIGRRSRPGDGTPDRAAYSYMHRCGTPYTLENSLPQFRIDLDERGNVSPCTPFDCHRIGYYERYFRRAVTSRLFGSVTNTTPAAAADPVQYLDPDIRDTLLQSI